MKRELGFGVLGGLVTSVIAWVWSTGTGNWPVFASRIGSTWLAIVVVLALSFVVALGVFGVAIGFEIWDFGSETRGTVFDYVVVAVIVAGGVLAIGGPLYFLWQSFGRPAMTHLFG